MTDKMMTEKMMTDERIDDKTTTEQVTNDKKATDKMADETVTADHLTAWLPSDGKASVPCFGPARLWVGFLELDAWARATDPACPVFLLPVAQPAAQDGPFQSQDLLVCCQQVTTEGHVLYCHLRASTLTRVCGEAVDADWRERAMAWESLWECVEEVLQERGLLVVAATVARPANLPLVRGQAGGIRYDRANRCFRRVRPG